MKSLKKIIISIAILVISVSACAQKKTDATTNIAADSKAPEVKAKPVVPKKKTKLDTKLPWLQAKIWDYQSKPVTSPPRSVINTTFEGKPVYYVPAVCCDIPSELYAEDGGLMCYPSGGFTGAGDEKCPKFKLEYSDTKSTVIWKDDRKPAVTKRVVPDLQ